MSFPVHTKKNILIKKEINITWQDINTIFLEKFEENLEDQQVYVNIHKSGLYKVACKFPMFHFANVILLGSHPNPLIYVMGPRHSQESINPILIIVSG